MSKELFEIIGKGALRLADEKTQVIGDTNFVKIDCFNQLVIQRGGVLADASDSSLTYDAQESVHAELRIGINVEFASTEEIEFVAYINGEEYSSNYARIQGNGAGKPVSAFWISEITVNPADKIEIRGRNADNGNLNLTYHRTTLVLKIDG